MRVLLLCSLGLFINASAFSISQECADAIHKVTTTTLNYGSMIQLNHAQKTSPQEWAKKALTETEEEFRKALTTSYSVCE